MFKESECNFYLNQFFEPVYHGSISIVLNVEKDLHTFPRESLWLITFTALITFTDCKCLNISNNRLN